MNNGCALVVHWLCILMFENWQLRGYFCTFVPRKWRKKRSKGGTFAGEKTVKIANKRLKNNGIKRKRRNFALRKKREEKRKKKKKIISVVLVYYYCGVPNSLMVE